MRLIDADAIPWTDLNDDLPYTKIKVLITFADKVNRMPTIEERKTGKWIDGKVKHIENGELRNVRECSECGSSYFVYDNYNSVDEIPNFCPNCGADMRGGNER